MPKYIKIHPKGFNAFIEPVEKAKQYLDTMIEENDVIIYEFQVVEMTEEEYNNLPEFDGF